MSSYGGRNLDLPVVELSFDSFVAFIDLYSSRLTSEGVFLLTTDLYPPKAKIELKLTLTDGFPLIVGIGQILWSQAEGSPLGMAVRFLELDPSCQALIDRIVRQSLSDGNKPIELEPSPAARVSIGQEPSLDVPPREKSPAPDQQPEPSTHSNDSWHSKAPTSTIPPPDRPGTVSRAHPSTPDSDIFDQLQFESLDDLLSPSPLDSVASAPTEVGAASGKQRVFPVGPGLLILLILSGVVGGFTHFMLERIVDWIVSPTETLEPTALDIPPESPPTPFPSPVATTSEDLSSISDADPLDIASPARAPDLGQLTKVRMITWTPVSAGTKITVWGDGEFRDSDCEHFRFGGDKPRELIKIHGVQLPFRQPISDVGSPELDRIRTGFHPRATRSELHIVLDLASPRARLLELDTNGNELHLLVGIDTDESLSGRAVSDGNPLGSPSH